jgi:hypothetical protein
MGKQGFSKAGEDEEEGFEDSLGELELDEVDEEI